MMKRIAGLLMCVVLLAGIVPMSQDVAAEKKQSERKAVWCSYEDLDIEDKSQDGFEEAIETMFDRVVSWGMNTVVVHVRPFSDAMYPSKYYPWSKYASGKQGRNPGYDPLAIMVEEAHERGLRIEAWINPYRISNTSIRLSSLPKNHPARKWSAKKATKRNVLTYGGKVYYNPAKKEVRQLIVNGVKEIVTGYDVDAIHFDDYFYPTMPPKQYQNAFDAPEYRAYVKQQKKQNKGYKGIVNWRRSNVSTLVKEVYQAIKKINPDVEFGISPAGNIENLRSKNSYYVDIDTWLKNPGYVDYICPQIYWGFQNGQYSYDKVLDSWTSLERDASVNLYVGLAMYRTVYISSSEWKNKKNVMQRSVAYTRAMNDTDGFYFFTYSSFLHKSAVKEKKNLIKELKKK